MRSSLALTLAGLLVLAWLLGGLLAARLWLRLSDGVTVACAALPLGLLAQVLVVNALAQVTGAPAALWLGALLAALAAPLILRRAPALEWSLEARTRQWLLAAGLLTFAATLALGLRELFGDDGGHASMLQMLAAGQFPPRFHGNPALRLSYAYGPNLLAAQALLVAGCSPWDAIDVVRAALVTSALTLAFLAGYVPQRRVGAGLLAAAVLVTVGPMVWVYLPLAYGPQGEWAARSPALAELVANLRHMTDNPWRYAVVVPGFVTSTFAHAQRALAWSAAPLPVLLGLALVEAPLSSARRSLALGSLLGLTALVQPAALFVLAPAVALLVAAQLLCRWRRRAAALELDLRLLLLPAALLAVFQGGPITDSLLDRFEGLANPTTAFHFDPLQWPSCRGREHTLRCFALSLANLGLMPWLLAWAAREAWRARNLARGAFALGCAAAYAFPFFVRYDYVDWNVQRVLTYSGWNSAALVAPLLYERLRASGAARAFALTALMLLSHQGLAAVTVLVDGTWLRDRVEPAFFGVGPLDAALAPLAERLPRDALVFDARPCGTGTNCRPAVLFGRYTSFSSERLEYERPTAAYLAVLDDPRSANLRAHGYSHLYLDSSWWRTLPADVRARFAGEAFETLGVARDATGFRALLRVCAPAEGCALRLPELTG